MVNETKAIVVNFRLYPSEVEALRQLARDRGVSVSAVIRAGLPVGGNGDSIMVKAQAPVG